jgi:hypothetical protein
MEPLATPTSYFIAEIKLEESIRLYGEKNKENKRVIKINKINLKIRFGKFLGFFRRRNKKEKQIGTKKNAAEILVAKPIPETRPDNNK